MHILQVKAQVCICFNVEVTQTYTAALDGTLSMCEVLTMRQAGHKMLQPTPKQGKKHM